VRFAVLDTDAGAAAAGAPSPLSVLQAVPEATGLCRPGDRPVIARSRVECDPAYEIRGRPNWLWKICRGLIADVGARLFDPKENPSPGRTCQHKILQIKYELARDGKKMPDPIHQGGLDSDHSQEGTTSHASGATCTPSDASVFLRTQRCPRTNDRRRVEKSR
jgi:hypothetical protein